MKTQKVIYGFNRHDALSRLADLLKSNVGFEEHPKCIVIDGLRRENDT